MLSMPPATITLLVPALSRSWASITAFMPEPQSLLTVVQPVALDRPAFKAAWRAGPCLRPAGSTQPMITSCTSAWSIPAPAAPPPRAGHGLANGRGPQIDGGNTGQAALEAAHGGAGAADDDDIGHENSLVVRLVTRLDGRP